jgi:hypothetical protein
MYRRHEKVAICMLVVLQNLQISPAKMTLSFFIIEIDSLHDLGI